MMIIQPILTLLLAGAVIAYFVRLRSRLADRIIVLLLATAALVLVANPGLAILLAHAVGVGRGVDLIIYLTLFGYGFLGLLLISKVRGSKRKLPSWPKPWLWLLRANPPKEADGRIRGEELRCCRRAGRGRPPGRIRGLRWQ